MFIPLSNMVYFTLFHSIFSISTALSLRSSLSVAFTSRFYRSFSYTVYNVYYTSLNSQHKPRSLILYSYRVLSFFSLYTHMSVSGFNANYGFSLLFVILLFIYSPQHFSNCLYLYFFYKHITCFFSLSLLATCWQVNQR